MSLSVLLDSGPLGMVTNPRATPETEGCRTWLTLLLSQGVQVYIPEIADYEVRRELIRANKTAGIARLDALIQALDYQPLSTEIMRKAAVFWASARNQGRPTADDTAIDGDVILAAQAAILGQTIDQVIIATTNVKHLDRYVDAQLWHEITQS